jgi:hypothetical protein
LLGRPYKSYLNVQADDEDGVSVAMCCRYLATIFNSEAEASHATCYFQDIGWPMAVRFGCPKIEKLPSE